MFKKLNWKIVYNRLLILLQPNWEFVFLLSSFSKKTGVYIFEQKGLFQ